MLMRSKPKRAFSTRLPAEYADLLEAAMDETNKNASEILRQAVRYYIRQNPDEIEALYSDDSIKLWIAEMGE